MVIITVMDSALVTVAVIQVAVVLLDATLATGNAPNNDQVRKHIQSFENPDKMAL